MMKRVLTYQVGGARTVDLCYECANLPGSELVALGLPMLGRCEYGEHGGECEACALRAQAVRP